MALVPAERTSSGPDLVRVAHVGPFVPTKEKGVHKTVAGLIDHLRLFDVETEVWTFAPLIRAPEWVDVGGVSKLRLPSRRAPASFLRGLRREALEAIVDRTQAVDLIHFHSVFVPHHVHAARAARVPYVITPNGGYGPAVLHGRNRWAKMLWMALREREFIRSAAGMHAVSPPEAEDLARLARADSVFYLPNAVPQSLVDRELDEPSEPTLLFIGRLAIDHKGLDLLLEGFARSKVRSSGARLLLVGPDFRNGAAAILDLARALGIADRVEVPGPVFHEAKWDLIERSAVFVHTSRWEGLPFSVLEASALGRPVLVTPGTNIADQVSSYDAGVVVDADPQSIADGIDRLMQASDDQRGAMGRRAKDMVRDNFTWPAVAEAMAKRYALLLGRSTG